MTTLLLAHAVLTGALLVLFVLVVLVQEGTPLVRRALRTAALPVPTGS